MKLRPYHNPENVDESKVPPGWRFRYADEMDFPDSMSHRYVAGWYPALYRGVLPSVTYIVPVNPTTL